MRPLRSAKPPYSSRLRFVCLTLALAPSAAVHAAPPSGGYWLSAELEGSKGARVQAATEMSGNEERVFPLDPAATLPGESVARIASIQEAMTWVARWAFDGRQLGFPDRPYRLREAPAPEPNAGLEARHEVLLRSLVVTGATSADGVRKIAWPLDQTSILPPDSEWRAAALIPEVAPMFAAPAPYLPPARERSGQARRSGGMYVLGYLDRCEFVQPRTQKVDDTVLEGARSSESERRCMRWAQVLARDQDAFTPGYLPAFQVAPLETWVRAPGNLPRGQLIASVIEGPTALFVLLVRLKDNSLHAQAIDLATEDGGFPDASLALEGDEAVISRPGHPPLRVELSIEMDRRSAATRPDAPPSPSSGRAGITAD